MTTYCCYSLACHWPSGFSRRQQLAVVEVVELELNPQLPDERLREDVWYPLDDEGGRIFLSRGCRPHPESGFVLLRPQQRLVRAALGVVGKLTPRLEELVRTIAVLDEATGHLQGHFRDVEDLTYVQVVHDLPGVLREFPQRYGIFPYELLGLIWQSFLFRPRIHSLHQTVEK